MSMITKLVVTNPITKLFCIEIGPLGVNSEFEVYCVENFIYILQEIPSLLEIRRFQYVNFPTLQKVLFIHSFYLDLMLIKSASTYVMYCRFRQGKKLFIIMGIYTWNIWQFYTYVNPWRCGFDEISIAISTGKIFCTIRAKICIDQCSVRCSMHFNAI